VTVLQSLDRYYDRMARRGEVDASEYCREKISLRVVLAADGTVRQALDIREPGKRRTPQILNVPSAVKRTVGVLPNRLWDKTSYALGQTAKPGTRTAVEHAAFKAANLALIGNTNDPGLVAFRRFLDNWLPGDWDALDVPPELLDGNVVFQLEDELADIHASDAARRLLARAPALEGEGQFCLVTGTIGPVARLHPSIKGVPGAQTAGASLVSFNLDAFTSHGKEQGNNAPTSETAAARYGAALNRMLAYGGDNRLRRPLGDAAVVFWADTSDTVDEAVAAAAEGFFAAAVEPADDDPAEAKKLSEALDLLAAGRPVREASPRLLPGTRFHVLGLSPNAARLSVRFWLDDTFETIVRRLAAHHAALRMEPPPWRSPPSVTLLLANTTALLREFKNIPPHLAGEVMRAVLSGAPYPRAWLAAAIIRLRAGDSPARGWHAAAIRAVLSRLPSEETPPVALDPENSSQAYQLGRLFAVLEAAQREALGRVNASIADRYYGAASATPARVFGPLLRGARTHVADANKRGRGLWLNGRIGQIMTMLDPELPRTLRLEDQGRFAVGYYHERATRAPKPADAAPTESDTTEGTA
jgi:CRISPR-associated protein Csd1